MKNIFYAVVLLFYLTACGPEKPLAIQEAEKHIPEKIDFNFHVKPILSDKCFACHGPDEANQKADLRLDTEEGAFAALGDNKDHYALVPKRLSKSHAYLRIISENPDEMMPPPESNLSLSSEEIAIITRWIEQGAEYKPHWSFIKPEKPEEPSTENKEWSKNPIDKFILARLEQEELAPSPEADKESLIRRLSFDLRGLPPTLQEIDEFLADDSPNAYEKLVDQYLASAAYGERMAANWMDVARFADSDGYLDDKHRDFTPWRDWVIQTFNKNMPYDQFVNWQLAGDQIPNPTQESILATAFNRLHKRNSEAGIVFEEYRVEYVADRVQTLGNAFLGLSLECARCHDHKYDPISQENYYQLFGYFNSTNEIGHPVYGPDQTPGPALLLSTKEEENIIDFLDKKTRKFEAKLANYTETAAKEYSNRSSSHKLTSSELDRQIRESMVAYYPFDEVNDKDGKPTSPSIVGKQKPAEFREPIFKDGVKGKAFFVSDYNSAQLGEKVGWHERTEPFSFSLWVYPDTTYNEVGVLYHCEDLRLGFKGYSLHLDQNHLQFIMAHSWPQNAIQITSKKALTPKKWTQITITYNGSSTADGVKLYFDGKSEEVSTDYDNLYKGILYEYDIHTYGFKGVTLGQRSHIVPFKNGGIDEIKFFDKELSSLEVLYDYDKKEAASVLSNPEQAPNKKLLEDYFLAHVDPEIQVLQDSLFHVRNELNKVVNNIQEIMVMGDMEEPRTTYLLERGQYNAHGQEVEPDVPEKVMPISKELPANRYGLAQWLFDEDHPLTARVYVNRLWQMHFGKGLVKTSEDFGNQGELPSHPELLDWLAVSFRESDWDIKAMHKLMVMSATYRQSSVIKESLAEKDPENILLARAPRFRFPAEMIRDNALKISGLLVDTIGGKSVYPYQPAGLWNELTDKSWRYEYLQEPGDGLYRRSLYTVWKRTSPPPSMLIFDVPERGVCTVRRKTTSTPLQALVLLNDPQYLEASRVLSEKLYQDNPNDIDQQLEKAFRLITGRKPDDQETNMLTKFYQEELSRFKENPKDAVAYLEIGEKPRENSLSPEPVAALATVANSIMNTNEAYTRK